MCYSHGFKLLRGFVEVRNKSPHAQGWCLGRVIFTGKVSDDELEPDASRENTLHILLQMLLCLYFTLFWLGFFGN